MRSKNVPVINKTRPITIDFSGGLNTFTTPLSINDNELTSMSNLCYEKYPALTTVPGMKTLSSGYTQIRSVFSGFTQTYGTDTNIYVVDGTNIFVHGNAVPIGTLTTAPNNVVLGCGTVAKMSTGNHDYIIYTNGTDRMLIEGGTVSAMVNAPTSNIVVHHRGRLWWIKDDYIYISALYTPDDYSITNDGISDFMIPNKNGNLTGLVSYDDKLIIFAEKSMHIVSNTDGAIDNFYVYNLETEVGCTFFKSIVICDSVLYWAWNNEIYRYNGVKPEKISQPLNAFVDHGGFTYSDVATTDGRNIYINSYATDTGYMFVYDTLIGKWYIRDFLNGFFSEYNNSFGGNSVNGILHGSFWGTTISVFADNTDIQPFASNGTWNFITKAFQSNPGYLTDINKLWIEAELPTGSTLKVAYSTSVDNNDFVDIATFTVNNDIGIQKFYIPTDKLYNLSYYRFKVYGTGPATIYSLSRELRVRRS